MVLRVRIVAVLNEGTLATVTTILDSYGDLKISLSIFALDSFRRLSFRNVQVGRLTQKHRNAFMTCTTACTSMCTSIRTTRPLSKDGPTHHEPKEKDARQEST